MVTFSHIIMNFFHYFFPVPESEKENNNNKKKPTTEKNFIFTFCLLPVTNIFTKRSYLRYVHIIIELYNSFRPLFLWLKTFPTKLCWYLPFSFLVDYYNAWFHFQCTIHSNPFSSFSLFVTLNLIHQRSHKLRRMMTVKLDYIWNVLHRFCLFVGRTNKGFETFWGL